MISIKGSVMKMCLCAVLNKAASVIVFRHADIARSTGEPSVSKTRHIGCHSLQIGV